MTVLMVPEKNMKRVRMELKSRVFLEDNRSEGHVASSINYEIPCLTVISLLK